MINVSKSNVEKKIKYNNLSNDKISKENLDRNCCYPSLLFVHTIN